MNGSSAVTIAASVSIEAPRYLLKNQRNKKLLKKTAHKYLELWLKVKCFFFGHVKKFTAQVIQKGNRSIRICTIFFNGLQSAEWNCIYIMTTSPVE